MCPLKERGNALKNKKKTEAGDLGDYHEGLTRNVQVILLKS